jgi:hypothetical protein
MPPKERSIVAAAAVPESDGWYVVDVAYNAQNPVHRAMMRVTNRGRFAVIASTSVEEPADRVESLHFLRIVRRVDMGGAA